jgi:hypothetical protein
LWSSAQSGGRHCRQRRQIRKSIGEQPVTLRMTPADLTQKKEEK